jgi:hypothetical protein
MTEKNIFVYLVLRSSYKDLRFNYLIYVVIIQISDLIVIILSVVEQYKRKHIILQI